MKDIKGITLITLVITIVVLLILSGITINMVADSNNGIIGETKESKETVERESLINKIKAELFEEKNKKGRELTDGEKNNLISQYGQIENENLNTNQGNYIIPLTDITN